MQTAARRGTRIDGAYPWRSGALGRVRRPPLLRLCRLLPALVSNLFPPLIPLLPILLLLILALGSRILMLLACPSHQCTSERARSVKIIRRWGGGRDGDGRQGLRPGLRLARGRRGPPGRGVLSRRRGGRGTARHLVGSGGRAAGLRRGPAGGAGAVQPAIRP